MEAGKPITGRIISTDCFYTSIESANWLLDRGIATVGTLQKGRIGIPSDFFDIWNREIFSATCHFKSRRRTFAWHLTPSKQSQNERKVVLSTSRPLHGRTIYDSKEKPHIIKFYDFKKDGTDRVNEYYTTR